VLFIIDRSANIQYYNLYIWLNESPCINIYEHDTNNNICLPVTDQMELDHGLQRGLQLRGIDELQSRLFV